jgi:hypothetical protein
MPTSREPYIFLAGAPSFGYAAVRGRCLEHSSVLTLPTA